ncbi:MAG: hypothetical protein ABSC06_22590, partial [Rhodopila sp.]
MSLPDGFALDTLLAPIPGALPQGVDVREDYSAQSPYNRLRDARSEARDAEKQMEANDPDSPAADPAPLWRQLRDLAIRLLTEQTKEGLADRYWNDIYPLPDEYGVETRVAPITGLNGRSGGGSLMAPLFRIVLFHRTAGAPVALHQYQASARLATMDAAARQSRIATGTIPWDDIEKDARTVGRSSMAKLREDAADALAAWQAMANVLDEKAGADAPSTSHVRDLVREIAEIAALYAPDVPAQYDSLVSGTGGETSATGTPSDGMPETSAQAMTRESALRSLETLAAFFRRTEPHSPLSYTLDEAV